MKNACHKENLVSSKVVARRIAEAVFADCYGENELELQQAFSIEEAEDSWIITGHPDVNQCLPGMDLRRGEAHIEIMKKNGEVIDLILPGLTIIEKPKYPDDDQALIYNAIKDAEETLSSAHVTRKRSGLSTLPSRRGSSLMPLNAIFGGVVTHANTAISIFESMIGGFICGDYSKELLNLNIKPDYYLINYFADISISASISKKNASVIFDDNLSATQAGCKYFINNYSRRHSYVRKSPIFIQNVSVLEK